VDLQQIGAQHPTIKRVLDIQRNATANRDRLFVAEGVWAHEAVLVAGVPVEVFLWCPEAGPTDQARRCAALVAARAVRAYQVSARTLARVADRDRPEGLVSIARLPRWDLDALPLGGSALAVVADGIEIPGNLGTLIRTLDACRADCLLLTNRRTRLTHPKVLRGSHAMSLRVPTGEFDGPDAAAAWLLARGFTVYLADPGDADDYRGVAFGARTALVVGNERRGIDRAWYRHGFARVAVPMLGAADSLNVSVCASILLYEVRAQLDGWRPAVASGR
jgi:TrmH family RNA methyltransferase